MNTSGRDCNDASNKRVVKLREEVRMDSVLMSVGLNECGVLTECPYTFIIVVAAFEVVK